jgi:predicted CXXCH cytochrome family protein
VPNPPEGFEWEDIAYVIGGYTKKGRYVNQDGFTLTTGVDGVLTQWNLDFPPNGTQAGFVAYDSSRETPKPYDYSCFVCHTTGPMPQDEDFPEFQDNRPGMAGTFEEAGIQCESCHGPGSNHVSSPEARDMFVSTDSQLCGECHDRPFNNGGVVIQASGGYIRHHEQYPELLASGRHSALDCGTCHNPHASTIYDRDNGIIKSCANCHEGVDMALHAGAVYTRGDYSEEVTCESCHMPAASKSATAATADVVGDSGRMGDTRTHIFRIDTSANDYTAMFNAEQNEVVKDAEGRAAVTLDFVCLRCHNGIGNAISLTLEAASSLAVGLHGE